MLDPQIAVALLAAGRATRFGGGKLDAGLNGKPVGLRAAEVAENAGFLTRIIVTSDSPPNFIDQLVGWHHVINPDAKQGLSTSICAAVRAGVSCRRLVITLADMPIIQPAHLESLAHGSTITFTRYPDGRRGVPAAFPSRHFARLANLTKVRGAADVDWDEEAQVLTPKSPTSLLDIDHVDELEKLEALLGST